MLGSDALALGHLELLWQSAYKSGEPVIGDAIDVEAAARWRGPSGDLCKALLEAGGPGRPGFIEYTDGGLLAIHDFWVHAPAYVRKRRTREDQRNASGKAMTVHTPSADQSVTSQRMDSDRSLSATPYTLHPTPINTPSHPPTARVRTRETAHAEDEDFEKAFWPAYPNKKAKRAARAAWDKAKKENRLPVLPELLARLERLKSSREWQKDGGAFIPHPATWINADGWHDEPASAPASSPQPAPPSPALRMRPEILDLPNGKRVWTCRAPDGTVVSQAGWIPRWGPWPMCAENWPAEWGPYPGDEPPQDAAPPAVRPPIPSTLFDLEAPAS
jgi:hypothetical protein